MKKEKRPIIYRYRLTPVEVVFYTVAVFIGGFCGGMFGLAIYELIKSI